LNAWESMRIQLALKETEAFLEKVKKRGPGKSTLPKTEKQNTHKMGKDVSNSNWELQVRGAKKTKKKLGLGSLKGKNAMS